MNASIIQIDPLCTDLVNFYTVKFEGKSLSEYALFYNKISAREKNREELNVIQETIYQIGERGALRCFFDREENNAYALPPKHDYVISAEDYGIRLYCVVLSKRIVFLLNGDRKKKLKALDPFSNVSHYFRQANSLHEGLMRDKREKLIGWNGDGKMLDYDKDYLIDIRG